MNNIQPIKESKSLKRFYAKILLWNLISVLHNRQKILYENFTLESQLGLGKPAKDFMRKLCSGSLGRS